MPIFTQKLAFKMLKMALKFYVMDLWWLGNSALDLATIQINFINLLCLS